MFDFLIAEKSMAWMELGSYVATIIGFPFAIMIFWREQRAEVEGEEEGIYASLSQSYVDFMKMALSHSDLGIFSHNPKQLDDEQKERRFILFGILISLFERAYLLVHEDKMNKKTARMWQTWEDYISEWIVREDFRSVLPDLLRGEDPEFIAYMQGISETIKNK